MKEIYCNNLELSDDRRKNMSLLFKSLGYTEETFRFNAYLGSQFKNKPTKLSFGKTGNLLSHMSIWKTIADKPDGFYMVMEDDLVLADNIDLKEFGKNMDQMISEIPESIGLIHCSRDISKAFVKNKFIAKFKPRYKVIAHFGSLEVKKCSLIYPWSTETGAYMIRPKYAKKLFKHAQWLVKYDKQLPIKNNVDILISRSIMANFSGAMVRLFKQNMVPSIIKQVNITGDSNTSDKSIDYDKNFFERASERISPWFHEK